jgi:predicted  nucleic acid-binding Zn-ribbon protein
MKTVIESLYNAQALLRKGTWEDPESQTVIKELRTSVPAPILAHYLRAVESGRNGVALVRHGVCCQCHIRIPAGTQASLVHPKDIHLCDSCGAYLMIAPEEMANLTGKAAPAPVARRRGRPPLVAVLS